jgi:DNA-binding response OmpR family regulator
LSDRGFVFVVDHDTASADALQELLEKEGYAVEKSAVGKKALKAIVTAEPNLVLLDAHLPDVNPFELLGPRVG